MGSVAPKGGICRNIWVTKKKNKSGLPELSSQKYGGKSYWIYGFLHIWKMYRQLYLYEISYRCRSVVLKFCLWLPVFFVDSDTDTPGKSKRCPSPCTSHLLIPLQLHSFLAFPFYSHPSLIAPTEQNLTLFILQRDVLFLQQQHCQESNQNNSCTKSSCTTAVQRWSKF